MKQSNFKNPSLSFGKIGLRMGASALAIQILALGMNSSVYAMDDDDFNFGPPAHATAAPPPGSHSLFLQDEPYVPAPRHHVASSHDAQAQGLSLETKTTTITATMFSTQPQASLFGRHTDERPTHPAHSTHMSASEPQPQFSLSANASSASHKISSRKDKKEVSQEDIAHLTARAFFIETEGYTAGSKRAISRQTQNLVCYLVAVKDAFGETDQGVLWKAFSYYNRHVNMIDTDARAPIPVHIHALVQIFEAGDLTARLSLNDLEAFEAIDSGIKSQAARLVLAGIAPEDVDGNYVDALETAERVGFAQFNSDVLRFVRSALENRATDESLKQVAVYINAGLPSASLAYATVGEFEYAGKFAQPNQAQALLKHHILGDLFFRGEPNNAALTSLLKYVMTQQGLTDSKIIEFNHRLAQLKSEKASTQQSLGQHEVMLNQLAEEFAIQLAITTARLEANHPRIQAARQAIEGIEKQNGIVRAAGDELSSKSRDIAFHIEQMEKSFESVLRDVGIDAQSLAQHSEETIHHLHASLDQHKRTSNIVTELATLLANEEVPGGKKAQASSVAAEVQAQKAALEGQIKAILAPVLTLLTDGITTLSHARVGDRFITLSTLVEHFELKARGKGEELSVIRDLVEQTAREESEALRRKQQAELELSQQAQHEEASHVFSSDEEESEEESAKEQISSASAPAPSLSLDSLGTLMTTMKPVAPAAPAPSKEASAPSSAKTAAPASAKGPTSHDAQVPSLMGSSVPSSAQAPAPTHEEEVPAAPKGTASGTASKGPAKPASRPVREPEPRPAGEASHSLKGQRSLSEEGSDEEAARPSARPALKPAEHATRTSYMATFLKSKSEKDETASGAREEQTKVRVQQRVEVDVEEKSESEEGDRSPSARPASNSKPNYLSKFLTDKKAKK